MNWTPFETIEDVESIYCKKIFTKEYGYLTVVGCLKNKNGLDIICSNFKEKEIKLSSEKWFEIATLDGHKFGKLK